MEAQNGINENKGENRKNRTKERGRKEENEGRKKRKNEGRKEGGGKK